MGIQVFPSLRRYVNQCLDALGLADAAASSASASASTATTKAGEATASAAASLVAQLAAESAQTNAATSAAEAAASALAALANGLIYADQAAGIAATDLTVNKWFWVNPSMYSDGALDLFLNVSSVAVAKATLPNFGLLTDTVTTGRGVAAVDGSGLTQGTYVFATPPNVTGRAARLRVYGKSGGATIQLKRFTRAGNDLTQVGSDIAVVVGSGALVIDAATFAALAIQPGELFGFYLPTTGRLAYTAATAAESGGHYYVSGNSSGFTDASADTGLRLEIGIDWSYTYVNTARVKQMAADLAAVITNAALANTKADRLVSDLTQHQLIGRPVAPVDGTSLTGSTYVFAEPLIADGLVDLASFWGESASPSFVLSRWTRAGNDWTKVVGSERTVSGAAGVNSVAVDLPCLRGERLGFSVASGQLAYLAATAGDSGGYYLGSAGAGSFTDSSADASLQLQVGFRVRLLVPGEAVHRVNLRNSNRVALLSNSYGASVYTPRGKSWLAKVSAFSDWCFENYSKAGDKDSDILARIRALTVNFGNLTLRDYGASHMLVMEDTNSAGTHSLAANLDNKRQLIETVRGLGAVPILATEHVDPAYGVGMQAALRQVADENGAYFIDVMDSAKRLAASSPYAGFYVGTHPGVRTNELLSNPVADFMRSLGRPRQAMKIFRKRAGVTVSSLDDLAYHDNFDRARLFAELQLGESALTVATEGWHDELNATGSYSTEGVNSEYLALMNSQSVSFADYALIEVTVDATPRSMRNAALILSDSSVTVYVQDVLGSPYPGAGLPVGKWVQLAGSNGRFSIPGTLLRRYMRGDKLSFLVYKASSYSLYEPELEWIGEAGKPAAPARAWKRARGAEMLAKTVCDSTTGWTLTGAPAAAAPADGLPTGYTAAITVDASNKIAQTVAYAASSEDRELEILVACRRNPAIFEPDTQVYPSASSITGDSFDWAKLTVEVVTAAGAAPAHEPVGLWWKECAIRTIAPAGSTGLTVRISGTSALEILRASVKPVDL